MLGILLGKDPPGPLRANVWHVDQRERRAKHEREIQ